jgi:hypothetical protein
MGNSMATGMVFINIQGTCPKILTNEIACKLKTMNKSENKN